MSALIKMSSAHISSALKVRDVGFGSVWSKEDHDYVLRLLRKRDPSAFEDRLLSIWNDHKLIREEPRFAPIEVTYKEDLVVTAGMTRIAQLMTGDSTTSFRYFASGTGTNAEALADTALQTESVRVDMDSSGDRYGSGTSAKFVGFFPTASTTATIAEGGAFDAGAVGTMLFRTKYSSTISHVSGTTIYVLQQTINQSSS